MKLIWYPAVSLDGYIAYADGNSDWVTEKDDQLFDQEVQSAGCVIVGRTTFEQYKDELYPIKGCQTYVVTTEHSSLHSTDSSITYVEANAKLICDLIARDGYERAILSGGGETNGLFADAGFIDEVIMSIYPLTLGSGIKMLGSSIRQLDLGLISSTSIGEGVIQNRYEVIK